MVSGGALSADEAWLLRLFRSLPKTAQQDAVVDVANLAVQVHLGPAFLEPGPLEDIEDRRRDANQQAIDSFRPFCEIHHLVGDYWSNILESLFQDGLDHALLGTEDMVADYEHNLFEIIEHYMAQGDVPYCDSPRLAAGFLRQWRQRVAAELDERGARQTASD